MLRVKILTIGRPAREYQQLVDHYLKNLRCYAKVEIQFLADFSKLGHKQAIENESTNLLQALPKNSQVIVFDEHGRTHTSLEFSLKLGTLVDQGQNLTLVVGGPYGLTPEFLKKQQCWSMSLLTFPHQLALVILLEQLYRGLTIHAGKAYHN
jgi:23S rRNA (pseudouridine1915-N3)-methyltransferase